MSELTDSPIALALRNPRTPQSIRDYEWEYECEIEGRHPVRAAVDRQPTRGYAVAFGWYFCSHGSMYGYLNPVNSRPCWAQTSVYSSLAARGEEQRLSVRQKKKYEGQTQYHIHSY